MFTIKVLILVDHPAQIHLYRNLVWQLQERGHKVKIAACVKEVMVDLLDSYGFDYGVLFNNEGGPLYKKAMIAARGEIEMLRLTAGFRPDIFFSATSEIVAPARLVFRKPHIGITDTEHASISNTFAYPATDVILTPSSFKSDLGAKQVRFDGCKELAYLHPNHFKPDPAVLEELGLSERDNIFMVRFAAFNAGHDVRSQKFAAKYVPQLIDKLQRHGEIIISSEVPLDGSLKKYQRTISPAKYLDLMAYSSLYVGEGSSSANEAGILGVPSLHFERLSDGKQTYGATAICGIMAELQDKYGLIYSFHEEEKLLAKLDEILADLGKARKDWMARRERFLRDKIDVTSFLAWFLENYPESMQQVRQNPSIQHNFK
ncbi:DUF354 domain-containing protein [Methanocella sp. MCL-LM]|uniref:DUF354 domain-containing protein n=1 Tax=Methanocella sp. MCL-LM TaxID=3412035 RepID=UPI003C78F0F2